MCRGWPTSTLDIRSSAQPQVSTIELEKKRDLDHNPEQPIYHETGYHSTNSLIKNESAKSWHWQHPYTKTQLNHEHFGKALTGCHHTE